MEATMRIPRLSLVLVALAVLGNVHRADAFDVDAAFPRGGYVLSLEGGYGEQFDAWNTTITGFDFFNAGVRFGFLPWGAVGSGPLKGAFEIGLEPIYQRFFEPEKEKAFFAGLGAVARYHFLPLGRFVPYVELGGAPGYTDLNSREQQTNVVFLLFGGVGASFFVSERTALYAGYRLQHVSNADTSSPNMGINSHTGVIGVSIFFR
jgi:opacity protein-like surface antigen